MILPFQKNYPLGCNLSFLFHGPWVNFSWAFILFLKQNQPSSVLPPADISALGSTHLRFNSPALVSINKDRAPGGIKHKIMPLPPPATTGKHNRKDKYIFSMQKAWGWGWGRGQLLKLGVAEDPAFSKAGAGGCSSILCLCLVYSWQLPKAQPFPHHSQHPLSWRCDPSTPCSAFGGVTHVFIQWIHRAEVGP